MVITGGLGFPDCLESNFDLIILPDVVEMPVIRVNTDGPLIVSLPPVQIACAVGFPALRLNGGDPGLALLLRPRFEGLSLSLLLSSLLSKRVPVIEGLNISEATQSLRGPWLHLLEPLTPLRQRPVHPIFLTAVASISSQYSLLVRQNVLASQCFP